MLEQRGEWKVLGRFFATLAMLFVAPSVLSSSLSEQIRSIAGFYEIQVTDALADSQQASLNPDFSTTFAQLDDLNRETVTKFGIDHPDRLVAFRDYLQLLTQKGYIEASQALSLLEFAIRSAAESDVPIIGSSRNKIVTASTPYDAKLPPPTTDTLKKQISESATPERGARPGSDSIYAIDRNTYSDLAVSGESNRVYVNGRDVGTFGGVSALFALTKKTQPLFFDGALTLNRGSVYSRYYRNEEELSSVEASLGVGLFSGLYNPIEFTGLESSAKVSSEWTSGSIGGSSVSGRESYVSLGVIGGNGNTAVEYEVGTPASDFIDTGFHTVKLVLSKNRLRHPETGSGE